MYDFDDVSETSKAEQIRAWAIEESLDFHVGGLGSADQVIATAKRLEDFVLNGADQGDV